MVDRLVTVARRERVRSVCLSGGVACNALLRARVAEEAARHGVAASRSARLSPSTTR
jgi:tRNA A37 threonylcarbamoyltransferase TsaD